MRMGNIRFDGKVAIVTGSTRGIGQAIADLLSDLGADVIYTGTAPSAQVRGQYIQLELSKQDSLDSFFATLDSMPAIDILINNAGINAINYIQDIKDSDWENIININLSGAMKLCRYAANRMIPKKSGSILNISSIFGVVSKEMRSAYSASKSGMIGLTRAMALDLGEHQIQVNALCPGFTRTDLTAKVLGEGGMKEMASQIPLQRLADVSEIAKIAILLVSNWNTYITGQEIIVDGGFTIH